MAQDRRLEGDAVTRGDLRLVAYLSAKEKADAVSTRVIYNCLTPFHSWPEETRPVEASFRGYPEELQKKVMDEWKEYGF